MDLEVETPALLPWVEKYRPASLDQLVAHEDGLEHLSCMNMTLCKRL